MTIHEPATFATDLLLAGLAALFAFRLRQPSLSGPGFSPSRCWWKYALGLLAISSVLGGTYHGFAREQFPQYARIWWLITLFSIHLVSAALGVSLLHALLPARRQKPWRLLIFAKLLFFAGFAVLHPRFFVPIIDYGSTLLAWFVAAVALRPAWSSWMTTAILLSGTAAAIQQLKLGPSAFFNHNDLYHVIQAVALFAFYQAARRLPARSA
ncbi:MAG: hypothetical protein QM760_21415 [Nibricoccus sp.]